MANTENLLHGNPDTQFKSGREAVEAGRKGGIASGESKRREKTLRETLEKLLSLPIQDEATKDFIRGLGFQEDELNNKTAMNVSMYQEALKGNTKAFELIRDTIGEKPTDRLQIEEAPVIKLERPKK